MLILTILIQNDCLNYFYWDSFSRISGLLVHATDKSITCSSIRMTEGIDKYSERKLSRQDQSSPIDDIVMDSIPLHLPAVVSGPEALLGLNGFCFTHLYERNVFSVCPFQNVHHLFNVVLFC